MTKLRIGIVGVGAIAGIHAKALLQTYTDLGLLNQLSTAERTALESTALQAPTPPAMPSTPATPSTTKMAYA